MPTVVNNLAPKSWNSLPRVWKTRPCGPWSSKLKSASSGWRPKWKTRCLKGASRKPCSSSRTTSPHFLTRSSKVRSHANAKRWSMSTAFWASQTYYGTSGSGLTRSSSTGCLGVMTFTRCRLRNCTTLHATTSRVCSVLKGTTKMRCVLSCLASVRAGSAG